MRRISTPGAVAVILGVLLAASGSTPQPESGAEEETSLILSVLEAQERAWNEGDIETYMDGYHRSPETVFASGGSVTYGWQAVLDRYTARYDTREKMGTLSFTVRRLDFLGERHAKVLGGWELERGEDSAGGLFTLVFEKFPEGWRIIHDHTSSRH
jgi:ketosteroid isomerase-like protein